MSNIAKPEVVIVPNPSNGRFEIRTNTSETLRILVTNTLGEVVFDEIRTMDASHLIELKGKPGLYQILVMGESFSASKSLVIQP